MHDNTKVSRLETAGRLFSCDRKFLSHETLREDRTAAVRKYVAEATRRRRRILLAGFFFIMKPHSCCTTVGEADGSINIGTKIDKE